MARHKTAEQLQVEADARRIRATMTAVVRQNAWQALRWWLIFLSVVVVLSIVVIAIINPH